MTKDQIMAELHKSVGLCGHCGKRKCAGRESNSYLPEMIHIADIIQAIDRAAALQTTGEI